MSMVLLFPEETLSVFMTSIVNISLLPEGKIVLESTTSENTTSENVSVPCIPFGGVTFILAINVPPSFIPSFPLILPSRTSNESFTIVKGLFVLTL